jgi:hypothetical protein
MEVFEGAVSPEADAPPNGRPDALKADLKKV